MGWSKKFWYEKQRNFRSTVIFPSPSQETLISFFLNFWQKAVIPKVADWDVFSSLEYTVYHKSEYTPRISTDI